MKLSIAMTALAGLLLSACASGDYSSSSKLGDRAPHFAPASATTGATLRSPG